MSLEDGREGGSDFLGLFFFSLSLLETCLINSTFVTDYTRIEDKFVGNKALGRYYFHMVFAFFFVGLFVFLEGDLLHWYRRIQSFN